MKQNGGDASLLDDKKYEFMNLSKTRWKMVKGSRIKKLRQRVRSGKAFQGRTSSYSLDAQRAVKEKNPELLLEFQEQQSSSWEGFLMHVMVQEGYHSTPENIDEEDKFIQEEKAYEKNLELAEELLKNKN